MGGKKKGRPVGSVSRATLRGRPLAWFCHRAKTTTKETGSEDNRVFCYGFNDTDCLCDECRTCMAYVGNIDLHDMMQRCRQLEQLAREMYAAIAPMHVPCCEDMCLILADKGWPADACLQYFRQRLEELGVSLGD